MLGVGDGDGLARPLEHASLGMAGLHETRTLVDSDV
jgi:hypothetical protein